MAKDSALRQRAAALRIAIERIRLGQTPTDEELSTAPLLECWHVTEHHGFVALGGYVTRHPSLPDGAYILTSRLLWVSDDRHAARTASRFYRLGSSLEEALAQKS